MSLDIRQNGRFLNIGTQESPSYGNGGDPKSFAFEMKKKNN